MKVKLLTALSGSNGSYMAGDDYECDKKEAEMLVKKGLAEKIKTTKKTAKKKAKK